MELSGAVEENVFTEIDEDLKKWLKSILKESIQINDSVYDQFIDEKIHSLKSNLETGEDLLFVYFLKVFPLEEKPTTDQPDEIIPQAEEVDVMPVGQSADEKNKRKGRKKGRGTSKKRSKSSKGNEDRSSTENKNIKSKSATRNETRAISSKQNNLSPIHRPSVASVSKYNLRKKSQDISQHSAKNSNTGANFFLDDELDDAAPKEELGEAGEGDRSFYQMQFFVGSLPEKSENRFTVKWIFYLIRQNLKESLNIEWPEENTFESLSELILKYYVIGFVHNYDTFTCTMSGIKEILKSQLLSNQENVSLRLTVNSLHVLCQSEEDQSNNSEPEAISLFSRFICKNTMKVFEEFDSAFETSNDIRELLFGNDQDKYKDLLMKVNYWMDTCQKMIDKEYSVKKREQKSLQTVLEAYLKKYVVAESLQLILDEISDLLSDDNNSLITKLITENADKWDYFSKLIVQNANEQKTVITFVMPLLNIAIMDSSIPADQLDLEYVSLTLDILLDMCSEFQQHIKTKHLIEGICFNVVSMFSSRMIPTKLFCDGSLTMNLHNTFQHIQTISVEILQWKRKLLKKLQAKFPAVDVDFNVWIKVLNQSLKTLQGLIEFFQAIKSLEIWLKADAEEENLLESKQKCLEMFEEIEQEFQQIDSDILDSAGAAACKRITTNSNLKLKPFLNITL